LRLALLGTSPAEEGSFGMVGLARCPESGEARRKCKDENEPNRNEDKIDAARQACAQSCVVLVSKPDALGTAPEPTFECKVAPAGGTGQGYPNTSARANAHAAPKSAAPSCTQTCADAKARAYRAAAAASRPPRTPEQQAAFNERYQQILREQMGCDLACNKAP
jgi:hypothetical protein